MKTVKKITVFYTDGTFEDFDKQNHFDVNKVAPGQPIFPTIYPTSPSYQYQWGGLQAQGSYVTSQYIPTLSTQNITSLTTQSIAAHTPQPLGSATLLSTQGIQALTSAQISSLSVSAAGPLYDDAGYRGGYTTKSFY